jgi:hypothetical protein
VFRLLWVNGVEIHKGFFQYNDKTLPRRRVCWKTNTFKNVQISVTDTEDTRRPSISISDDKQVQTKTTNFDDKTKIATPLRVLMIG